MLKVNLEEMKKRFKKSTYVIGTLAGTLLLTGCDAKEISTNSDTVYDVIDTTDNETLENGIVTEENVPNQNFKLVVKYRCELQEDEKWTVTSDKKMNMEIHTKGLPEGWECYMDNVHTDTTISSVYPTVNGVQQDTMDDRIHNALMLGFPISDEVSYFGVNQIEGQNDTFISGSFRGFSGLSIGDVDEKRYTESDYLDMGVTSNKISSIIDLIIIDDGEVVSCVSVPSEVKVSVWPYVKEKSGKNEYYERYYYDENYDDVRTERFSPEEYKAEINGHSLKKSK